MKRWFVRRPARECGGEGGKPGPCPEHLNEEGAAHGVGGSTPEEVKKGRDKLNQGIVGGVKHQVNKLSDYQHQAITDIKHLVGIKPADSKHATDRNRFVSVQGAGNLKNHGEHGVKPIVVTLKNKDPQINDLARYAHTHGMQVSLAKTGNVTQVRIEVPRKERSQEEKETMRMFNLAQAGDDSATRALADRLEEQGIPLGSQMAHVIAEDETHGPNKALALAQAKITSLGSLFKKPGESGESVEHIHKRWRCAESAEDSTPRVRVDREKGEIYDVLVLGLKARNKRRYTVEAREDAVKRGVYEGLAVYMGPHKRRRNAKRSPNDHGGRLEGVYLAPNGEVRARKLVVNRATRGGQIALEIAEKFPDQFGLSHHALVDGYEEGGEKIVTCIAEVTVADLVKDPGTTDGVFEEADMAEEATEDLDGGAATTATAPVTDAGEMTLEERINDLIGAIHDDTSLDDDVKLKATKDLMKLKKILTGEGDEEEEDEGDEGEGETTAEAEEVDVTALVRRLDKLEAAEAARKKQRPRSRARSTALEEATPTPPPPKPAPPKGREAILKAYEVE